MGADLGVDLPLLPQQEFRTMIETSRLVADSLDSDVAASTVPQTFKDVWRQFFTSVWAPYYNAHQEGGVTDVLSEATVRQLGSIHGQILGFRLEFARLGGRPSLPPPVVPPPAPPGGAEDPTTVLSTFAKGALVVGGIFGVGYLIRAVKGGS